MGASLRESRPREIALSLLRARRFSRNLGFTNQLVTVHYIRELDVRFVGGELRFSKKGGTERRKRVCEVSGFL